MEESGGGWRRLEDAGRGSLTAQCRGRVPAECGGRWWCACSQCNLLLLLLFSSFSSSSSPLPPLLALATCILAEGRRVEAWGISLFRCWAGTSPSICTWKFPLGFSLKIYIFLPSLSAPPPLAELPRILPPPCSSNSPCGRGAPLCLQLSEPPGSGAGIAWLAMAFLGPCQGFLQFPSCLCWFGWNWLLMKTESPAVTSVCAQISGSSPRPAKSQ